MRIIFTDESGGVRIMSQSTSWKGTMQELAAKHVPRGTTYQILDDTDIPADRTYRNAWREGKKAINVDMPAARGIFLDNVRILRNAKLVELDTEVIKAVEKGESTTALATEKQRLRDLPDTLSKELEKCETVEDFKAVNVEIWGP